MCRSLSSPALCAILLAVSLRICAAQSQANRDPRQLFQQAMAAQQRGDLQGAARAYQEVLRLQPNLVAAKANLGTVLADMGRYDEAIRQDRAALALVPDSNPIRLNLGLAYYKKNDFLHASAQLQKVHAAAPEDLRVAILLGDCEVHLNHAAAAVALLQPFEPGAPDNMDLAWILGQALLGDGHAQAGLQRITRVAEQRSSAEAWALVARTYAGIDDLADARKSVEKALKLNPQLPGVHTLDGMIDSYEGNDDRAATAFRQALAANPDDTEALTDLGTVLYAQHQLGAAQANIERALRLKPDSTLARYELARVEAAQGRTEVAIRNLEQVERAEPEWLKPHVELAALYFRVRRLRDGARERQIVDRLSAQQQRHKAAESGLSAAAPAP